MKLSRILYIVVVISLLFTSVAWAQTKPDPHYNQTLKTWAEARKLGETNEVVTGEGYIDFAWDSLTFSAVDSMLGLGDLAVAETSQEQTNAVKNSVLGQINGLIGGVYTNPPASSVYYAADVLNNMGLAKPAYAQGLGYSGLSPLQDLWKIFRNMSYMILVVVMIVIGFMIMFRSKMHAQTAITVQNALPNIVLTLIVITFSYAIVGLLIDLMYFLLMAFIAIVYNFFCTPDPNTKCFLVAGLQNPDPTLATVQAQYVNGSIGTLLGKVFSTLPDSVVQSGSWSLPIGGTAGAAVSVGLLGSGGAIAPLVIFMSLGAAIVGGAVGAFTMQDTLGFAAGVFSPFLLFLMGLALIFVFVRIFFILMNAYIQIIISTIFAPVILLFGAIPGQNTFGNWLLGIIGNLVVFPTVAVLLIVANAITYGTTETTLWTPPLISGVGLGLIIQPLIGFGIAMLTPTLVNSVKEMFHAKPVLPITPGMVVSPIMGGAQTAASTFMSFGYLRAGLGGITSLLKPGRGANVSGGHHQTGH